MPQKVSLPPLSFGRDLVAGLVVFFVALPLCLGIALASNAPMFSGIVAGIIGGIVVGMLSGSQTSVSGPAAGLTAVVAAQIATLGSYDVFLLAVMVAGLMQLALGCFKAGRLAAFFPSSVIKGLLTAIGTILVLKQIPHVLGHDTDPEGDLSFIQPDHESTFSELFSMLGDLHLFPAVVGLTSLLLLLAWSRIAWLRNSWIPAPVVVVAFGVAMNWLSRQIPGGWEIKESHLVQVPVAEGFQQFLGLFHVPDFSKIASQGVFVSGLTLGLVASLETLLNLEAVDKIDPRQRVSSPNRELLAQGFGNLLSGLLGGMPVTSVIVRSSVNINAGGQTRLSTIVHGSLMLACVALLPTWLNQIPLSCLAAILLVTGLKLASPKLIKQVWAEGRYQFLPFVATVVAIVYTDLLVGILLGTAVSVAFILNSNLRRPMRRIVEKHVGGDVLRIELANQMSFLNRASMTSMLNEIPAGTNLLLDAENTDYIDPDILDLIREYRDKSAPVRGVTVSLRGFRAKYQMSDDIQYVDCVTRELQSRVTPAQVLALLKEGNERFRRGRRLTRDLHRQMSATATGQHPLAAVLGCIDSRTPVEIVFDLGLGEVFSVRIAGNTVSPKVLGSLEYACEIAGAKLIVVMGHTRCGAIRAAVELADSVPLANPSSTCEHLGAVVTDLQAALAELRAAGPSQEGKPVTDAFLDELAVVNVRRSIEAILAESTAIRTAVQSKSIAIVGAIYDVSTGVTHFFPDTIQS